jgi:hypothetical protein
MSTTPLELLEGGQPPPEQTRDFKTAFMSIDDVVRGYIDCSDWDVDKLDRLIKQLIQARLQLGEDIKTFILMFPNFLVKDFPSLSSRTPIFQQPTLAPRSPHSCKRRACSRSELTPKSKRATPDHH